MPRRTTINIPIDVKTELEKIRREIGAGDWTRFFKKMIEIYEEWHRLTVEREVKQVLCNDLSESKATLAAWGKLLASKLRDPDKIATALRYLKLDASGEYTVDREQCEGVEG
jgi:predicted N-acyltransferase